MVRAWVNLRRDAGLPAALTGPSPTAFSLVTEELVFAAREPAHEGRLDFASIAQFPKHFADLAITLLVVFFDAYGRLDW